MVERAKRMLLLYLIVGGDAVLAFLAAGPTRSAERGSVESVRAARRAADFSRLKCSVQYQTMEDMVGRTPLVRVSRIVPDSDGNILLAKMEGNNPAGSVKDRYVTESCWLACLY